MSTLAFALAATIKHDGHGGVADLLATPAEAAAWLEQHQDQFVEVLGRPLAEQARRFAPRTPAAGAGSWPRVDLVGRGSRAPESGEGSVGTGTGAAEPGEVLAGDERVHGELLRVRRAVRALFARAVAPGAPSKADAHRLMDADAALRMINRAAGCLGGQKLAWEEGGEPVVEWDGRTADPVMLVVGAVGWSTIEFLRGPDRERLRACPAARCVRYFLQDDSRQLWCSASCGNRERVNRHYRKRHAG
jgi:predicted RNA-binding Zn ribbon-like protein